MKVDYYEAIELAADILEMEYTDDNEKEIEEKLMEEYYIDLAYFHSLLQKLADRIDLSISPLTNTPMIGFGNGKLWFVKKEITGKFIKNLLHWMMEGKMISKDIVWKKEVVNQKTNEIEFVLTVSKPGAIENMLTAKPATSNQQPATDQKGGEQ